MIARFLYLDTIALTQYMTALEGGSITESTTRSMRSGTGAGSAGARGVASVSGERSREEEESRTMADTDAARFDRLLRAASDQSDRLGWVEVSQPDVDLDGIGIGAMVSWECDVYVPENIRALARSGESLPTIEMMQTMLPAARTLGFDTEGLPSDEELRAVAGFISGLNASLVVVGEDDDTEWRVAGKLAPEFRHGDVGDIDGRARIVGKVAKIIAPGKWQPYLTFPGLNLIPRKQRRIMDQQRPEPGKEEEFLAGPAVMLDPLAIYR